jgi:surface antigen
MAHPAFLGASSFFRACYKNFRNTLYYYGQKWQCVEFVKRFYYDAKGHKMPDVMGHAKSFFDANLPDGTLNTRRGLIQYQNGSTNKPHTDDLLVFADTKYGHVGIVTQVGENSLEIIQQNILRRTRQQFSLVASNGHYFITSPRQPAGWLHQ